MGYVGGNSFTGSHRYLDHSVASTGSNPHLLCSFVIFECINNRALSNKLLLTIGERIPSETEAEVSHERFPIYTGPDSALKAVVFKLFELSHYYELQFLVASSPPPNP